MPIPVPPWPSPQSPARARAVQTAERVHHSLCQHHRRAAFALQSLTYSELKNELTCNKNLFMAIGVHPSQGESRRVVKGAHPKGASLRDLEKTGMSLRGCTCPLLTQASVMEPCALGCPRRLLGMIDATCVGTQDVFRLQCF